MAADVPEKEGEEGSSKGRYAPIVPVALMAVLCVFEPLWGPIAVLVTVPLALVCSHLSTLKKDG